ncbi:hypothetical protein ACODM8_16825 [Vibrio ostreicida]|uniref:Uncharacterized protein n=1 Tax=Vibrio ostreicida TaxID=526588 RepID=A0ABT8C0Y9_9VIBR|nr:hypothetical protein [Vibrio ostreicida]MDN3612025.1 hypothetical protein [Vibrio ostreicida]NPD08802.1 hypothetical protein [Vibrio ostreicida]
MKNRKLSLLLNEFVQLNQGGNLKLEANDALVCQFGARQIKIEDGARLGLDGQMVLVTELTSSSLSAEQALKLNADFRLTADGYIARIADQGYDYLRTITLPEHPQELLRLLNEFVAQATLLDNEIVHHVAD